MPAPIIDILASGRLKEPYWEAACAEYAKRLSRFCRLYIAEAPDHKQPPAAPKGAFVVALCSEGEMLSSEGFAARLSGWLEKGRVSFLIGGSNGLSDEAKAAAAFRLSISRMTWPHHMARAMLLEQIYRAFTIRSGGKYHK